MNKPTAYILTGLPYSGKSTLAKELVRRFGFKLASMDQVIEEMDMHSDTMSMEDWGKVYDEGHKRLKDYLSEGYSVVFDGGSLKRRERDHFKEIAQSSGAQYKLIYLAVPRDEVKRRWQNNLISQERDQLTDKTMNTAINMFEEISTNELAIIYSPDMNLDEWIRANIN